MQLYLFDISGHHPSMNKGLWLKYYFSSDPETVHFFI